MKKKLLCCVLVLLMITTFIPQMAFQASASVSGDWEYEVLSDRTAEITKYNGTSKNVSIPSRIGKFEKYEVISIGSNVFSANPNITSVTVPYSVKNIAEMAFFGCESLSEISLPLSLERIGYGAFVLTEYYENKANWENNALYIDNYLISACYIDYVNKEIESAVSGKYTVKKDTKVIADGAFLGCEDLTSIDMSNGVRFIGTEAFYGCTKLTSVIMHDVFKTIGTYAFAECTSLKSIELPEFLENIESSAFENCTALTSIKIPYCVEKISSYAFSGCTGLKSVNLSKGLTKIDIGAFSGCTSLKSITIPSTVEIIEYAAFMRCTNLTSVAMFKGTIAIGRYAFWGCNSMKTMAIPSSAEIIRDESIGYNDELEKISGFTIYGVKGTGAEIYAKENGFAFKPLLLTKLDKTEFDMGLGETYTLKVTKGNAPFKYSISDSSIATISSSGKITAKKTGTVKITVKSDSLKKATCELTVRAAPTKVSLNKTSITLGVGETFDLNSTVKTGTASCNRIYSSSNSSVASVKSSGGLITAKKAGTATITVKTFNGKTATCKVTVKKAPTKVSLNKTSITLGIGETFDFNSTVNSGAASYKRAYTTSNSSIAFVKSSGGLVTANKVGTTTIKVKTFNGKTATCKVTVKEAPTKVSLNKTKLTLKVGQTFDLNSSLSPGAASYDTTYSSTNPSVASVKSAGGLVTAKKAGTALIVVRTYNGLMGICDVFVKK